MRTHLKLCRVLQKREDKPGTQGVTLVELLIVIAIVGVLATLFLAGMARMKEMANQAKNISNLRTLHQGLMTVVTDGPPGYGKGPGFFPSYAGAADGNVRYVWTHLVAEKLGYAEVDGNAYRFTADLNSTPFRNPHREDPLVPTGDPQTYDGLVDHSHYAYNAHLGSYSGPTWRDTNPPYGHVNLALVARASKTIVITESDGDNSLDTQGQARYAPPGRNDDPEQVASVFVDGHVEILTREEILSNPWTYLFPYIK